MKHVIPIDDLIPHEQGEDCVCGPYIRFVQKDNSTQLILDGPIAEHHALLTDVELTWRTFKEGVKR